MKYKIVKWENIVIVLSLCPLMIYVAGMTLREMYITEAGYFLIGWMVLMFAAMIKVVTPAVILIFKDGFRKVE